MPVKRSASWEAKWVSLNEWPCQRAVAESQCRARAAQRGGGLVPMRRVRSGVPAGRTWQQHMKPRFVLEVFGALSPTQNTQGPEEDPDIQRKMSPAEVLLELMVKRVEHTLGRHVAVGAYLEEFPSPIKRRSWWGLRRAQ